MCVHQLFDGTHVEQVVSSFQKILRGSKISNFPLVVDENAWEDVDDGKMSNMTVLDLAIHLARKWST